MGEVSGFEGLRDSSNSEREARAEQYFERDLQGQRRWYSDKASKLKRRAQVLSLLIIVAGALIAFAGTFGSAPWVLIATGLLGALVTIAKGWERIARYDEAWMAYRVASERLKRERRLYTNGAGAYRGIGDEEEAYLQFVENIETIIAEEQQIYWQSRGSELAVANQSRSGQDVEDNGRA